MDIHCRKLSRLHAYWDAQRGRRAFPSRADIDPVDLRFILGYVTLVEVHDGPSHRYRFRLDGSALVELSGIDYTGRYLDELPLPEYAAFIKQGYDQVVATGQPFHYRIAQVFDDKLLAEECLVLPLSHRRDAVEMLLVGVTPEGSSQEPGRALL